jgi:hypothetical protein
MKPIKLANGTVVGYENDVSGYRKEIRSRSNALLGYYNPEEGPEGKTHDSSGRVVGFGDQRTRLLSDE